MVTDIKNAVKFSITRISKIKEKVSTLKNKLIEIIQTKKGKIYALVNNKEQHIQGL